MEKSCACQGKNLEKFIQPIMLSCLDKQAQNGYQLVRSISQYATLEGISPDPTGVYRYLHQMEQRGLISRDEQGLWHIQASGRACLSSWRKTIAAYTQALEKLTEQI